MEPNGLDDEVGRWTRIFDHWENSRSWKDFTFFRDLFDRRGVVDRSERAWIDSTTVLGPTILGSVLPLLSPITELLAGLPNGPRLAAVVVPVLLLATSISIICMLGPVPRSAAGFSREVGGPRSYRFTDATRRAAKWMLLPLMLVSVYQFHAAAPNVVFFRGRIAGYLCSDSGRPITQGSFDRT